MQNKKQPKQDLHKQAAESDQHSENRTSNPIAAKQNALARNCLSSSHDKPSPSKCDPGEHNAQSKSCGKKDPKHK